VFLTTDSSSKVYDFYEVDGTAPEGSALFMSESIRWERRPPTLAEGWRTARVKMSQVKKDQKAASEGERPKSLDPLMAAYSYLPSIPGCSNTDPYAGTTGASYSEETQSVGSWTYTFIRKDNQAVDITVMQPFVHDETGVWAATTYRVYPPDSLSPVLKSPSIEDLRSNTSCCIRYYAGDVLDHMEEEHAKVDAFYKAMEEGRPGQVDLIMASVLDGKLKIAQWIRLTYDGTTGVEYPFYCSYDGMFRYYIPIEFTEPNYYTTSSNYTYYTVKTAAQGDIPNLVFYFSKAE
jgi:hypothetical protein